MISRRALLHGAGAFVAGTAGLAGYAVGIEPFWMLTTRYRISPPGWPDGLSLRLAVIADLHACEPWMNIARIRGIVTAANALEADAILLLGDYVVAHRWVADRVPSAAWAGALSKLEAPLGVHAVLGNHDWWDDPFAQRRGRGPTESHRALEQAGIQVYENTARRLLKDGKPVWIAGLGDQYALRRTSKSGPYSVGVDDLAGTLSKITGDAPVVLMAHEPDIFPRVPPRVALTIAGHTHGGQVRIMGRPIPYHSRVPHPYSYGHFIDRTSRRFPGAERNLIVSGGLGCSVLPIRFGVPPEIVLIELAP